MLEYKHVCYGDNRIIDENKAEGEQEVERRCPEEDVEVVALELCRGEADKDGKQNENNIRYTEDSQCATIADYDEAKSKACNVKAKNEAGDKRPLIGDAQARLLRGRARPRAF